MHLLMKQNLLVGTEKDFSVYYKATYCCRLNFLVYCRVIPVFVFKDIVSLGSHVGESILETMESLRFVLNDVEGEEESNRENQGGRYRK